MKCAIVETKNCTLQNCARTFKPIACALAIIVGLGGLALVGVAIGCYLGTPPALAMIIAGAVAGVCGLTWGITTALQIARTKQASRVDEAVSTDPLKSGQQGANYEPSTYIISSSSPVPPPCPQNAESEVQQAYAQLHAHVKAQATINKANPAHVHVQITGSVMSLDVLLQLLEPNTNIPSMDVLRGYLASNFTAAGKFPPTTSKDASSTASNLREMITFAHFSPNLLKGRYVELAETVAGSIHKVGTQLWIEPIFNLYYEQIKEEFNFLEDKFPNGYVFIMDKPETSELYLLKLLALSHYLKTQGLEKLKCLHTLALDNSSEDVMCQALSTWAKSSKDSFKIESRTLFYPRGQFSLPLDFQAKDHESRPELNRPQYAIVEQVQSPLTVSQVQALADA